jgi:hypothetical protein
MVLAPLQGLGEVPECRFVAGDARRWLDSGVAGVAGRGDASLGRSGYDEVGASADQTISVLPDMDGVGRWVLARSGRRLSA